MPTLNLGFQVDVEETCGGCPMIWKGTVRFYDHEAPIFIHYRYWYLTIDVGGCEIFCASIDNTRADGVASWEEVEPHVVQSLANIQYIAP